MIRFPDIAYSEYVPHPVKELIEHFNISEFFDADYNVNFSIYEEFLPNGLNERKISYIILYITKMMMNSHEISKRALLILIVSLFIKPEDFRTYWYIEHYTKNGIDVSPQAKFYLAVDIVNLAPKSYQTWSFLYNTMITQSSPYNFDFLVPLYDYDNRNRHLFPFIKKICDHYQIHQSGFQLTKHFIGKQKKNGGAWNFRFNLLDYVDYNPIEEIQFAMSFIDSTGSNQSMCSYIYGIICKNKHLIDEIVIILEPFLKSHPEDNPCSVLLVQIYSLLNMTEKKNQLLLHLSKKDSLRRNFWKQQILMK